MPKLQQLLMSDFPAHQQMQLEAVAHQAEMMYHMLPANCDRSRCNCSQCWAGRVIAYENKGALPITLCAAINANRHAMRLLMASKRS